MEQTSLFGSEKNEKPLFDPDAVSCKAVRPPKKRRKLFLDIDSAKQRGSEKTPVKR
jgi:hypothetical protein